ncbi:hypothetical protein 0305phi8-36p069 [Bacillus phage 0305phi8-36]|uniref:hypothetical protein n=1 Tax=Bacillus phage 0305phi8-36 TaxID=458639 RepID=UPI00015A1FA1|nr:hypothetical protein ST0305phi8-36p069 [Bacillus phage 0305phi8-36]ABS83629.1 hypothetical protein 0305phi8-36p069 [Bacillus phage 0305phi8-36]
MEAVEKKRGPWSEEEDLILMKHMHEYTQQGYNQTDASAIISELHLPQRTAAAVASHFSGELRHEYARAMQLHDMLKDAPEPITLGDTSYDAIIHVLKQKAEEEEKFKLNHITLQEHYDLLQKRYDSLQVEYDDLERRHMELSADHNVFVRALQKAQEPVETVTLPIKNQVDNEEWVD